MCSLENNEKSARQSQFWLPSLTQAQNFSESWIHTLIRENDAIYLQTKKFYIQFS